MRKKTKDNTQGSGAKDRRTPWHQTRLLLRRLARVESPDTTYLPADLRSQGAPGVHGVQELEPETPTSPISTSEHWPIVMKKASGLVVRDVEGRRYLDMTACFGVLALGHRSKVSLHALRRQSARLIHGMGDVHPSEAKIKFLETLAKHSPFSSPRIILGQSGADAIEAAMKTAWIVTGKRRFLVFSGAYHGLSVGAMQLTTRDHFRSGFEGWNDALHPLVQVVPFPLEQDPRRVVGKLLTPEELRSASLGEESCASAAESLETLRTALGRGDVAGVFLEPLQGRAGDRVFPLGFVSELKRLCQEAGALVIADEIFTGFGRTGLWFGMEHHGVGADLICTGKVIGGGFPMSACIGDVIAQWPPSQGEARHTSTFLGHPLACAVGSATVTELARVYPNLQERLPVLEEIFAEFLGTMKKKNLADERSFELRGRGWMRGFWFYRSAPGFAAQLSEQLLGKGFVTLPSGPSGRVLSWTPPLILEPVHLRKFLKALGALLESHSANTPF